MGVNGGCLVARGGDGSCVLKLTGAKLDLSTTRTRLCPVDGARYSVRALVYRKVGNLVNGGKGSAYKYDGLGRLRAATAWSVLY